MKSNEIRASILDKFRLVCVARTREQLPRFTFDLQIIIMTALHAFNSKNAY